jgi:hypothetical protein
LTRLTLTALANGLTTAKALGLTVPPSLLLRANEVIDQALQSRSSLAAVHLV